jgi:hypothetical protein
LGPEALRQAGHERRIAHGGGVDGDLVGAPRERAPASATVRIPPPTVNGMKIDSATRPTISSVVCRASWLADVQDTSSSALGVIARPARRVAGVAEDAK